MAEPKYPFVPKSNRMLRPGQFWGIRLPAGGYAAGRVTVVPAFGVRDRVGFVVAVVDWTGDQEPNSDALAGREVIFQAKCGYDVISSNGAQILGLRPLAADGIVPIDLTDLSVGTVQRVIGTRAFPKAVENSVKFGH